MPMMITMTKGTPYPTIRDFVMVLLGTPNMLDLHLVILFNVFTRIVLVVAGVAVWRPPTHPYLTCLKILKLIIDIQTNVANKK